MAAVRNGLKIFRTDSTCKGLNSSTFVSNHEIKKDSKSNVQMIEYGRKQAHKHNDSFRTKEFIKETCLKHHLNHITEHLKSVLCSSPKNKTPKEVGSKFFVSDFNHPKPTSIRSDNDFCTKLKSCRKITKRHMPYKSYTKSGVKSREQTNTNFVVRSSNVRFDKGKVLEFIRFLDSRTVVLVKSVAGCSSWYSSQQKRYYDRTVGKSSLPALDGQNTGEERNSQNSSASDMGRHSSNIDIASFQTKSQVPHKESNGIVRPISSPNFKKELAKPSVFEDHQEDLCSTSNRTSEKKYGKLTVGNQFYGRHEEVDTVLMNHKDTVKNAGIIYREMATDVKGMETTNSLGNHERREFDENTIDPTGCLLKLRSLKNKFSLDHYNYEKRVKNFSPEDKINYTSCLCKLMTLRNVYSKRLKICRPEDDVCDRNDCTSCIGNLMTLRNEFSPSEWKQDTILRQNLATSYLALQPTLVDGKLNKLSEQKHENRNKTTCENYVKEATTADRESLYSQRGLGLLPGENIQAENKEVGAFKKAATNRKRKVEEQKKITAAAIQNSSLGGHEENSVMSKKNAARYAKFRTSALGKRFGKCQEVVYMREGATEKSKLNEIYSTDIGNKYRSFENRNKCSLLHRLTKWYASISSRRPKDVSGGSFAGVQSSGSTILWNPDSCGTRIVEIYRRFAESYINGIRWNAVPTVQMSIAAKIIPRRKKTVKFVVVNGRYKKDEGSSESRSNEILSKSTINRDDKGVTNSIASSKGNTERFMNDSPELAESSIYGNISKVIQMADESNSSANQPDESNSSANQPDEFDSNAVGYKESVSKGDRTEDRTNTKLQGTLSNDLGNHSVKFTVESVRSNLKYRAQASEMIWMPVVEVNSFEVCAQNRSPSGTRNIHYRNFPKTTSDIVPPVSSPQTSANDNFSQSVSRDPGSSVIDRPGKFFHSNLNSNLTSTDVSYRNAVTIRQGTATRRILGRTKHICSHQKPQDIEAVTAPKPCPQQQLDPARSSTYIYKKYLLKCLIGTSDTKTLASTITSMQPAAITSVLKRDKVKNTQSESAVNPCNFNERSHDSEILMNSSVSRPEYLNDDIGVNITIEVESSKIKPPKPERKPDTNVVQNSSIDGLTGLRNAETSPCTAATTKHSKTDSFNRLNANNLSDSSSKMPLTESLECVNTETGSHVEVVPRKESVQDHTISVSEKPVELINGNIYDLLLRCKDMTEVKKSGKKILAASTTVSADTVSSESKRKKKTELTIRNLTAERCIYKQMHRLNYIPFLKLTRNLETSLSNPFFLSSYGRASFLKLNFTRLNSYRRSTLREKISENMKKMYYDSAKRNKQKINKGWEKLKGDRSYRLVYCASQDEENDLLLYIKKDRALFRKRLDVTKYFSRSSVY